MMWDGIYPVLRIRYESFEPHSNVSGFEYAVDSFSFDPDLECPMNEARLLVETNRPNVILNLAIALGFFITLFLFVASYLARATLSPNSANQWVAVILDHFYLIALVSIPLFVLGRIIRDHVRLINHGYIAILDRNGIKVKTDGKIQHYSWSDIVRFEIVDRIMLIGVDRSIRPGRRKIHTNKVSLRYSSVASDEIIRRVAYERPDLFDTSIRREGLVPQTP